MYRFHVQQCMMRYTKCSIQERSVQDSHDSCTKTKWSSSMDKLCCEHARKNWRVTQSPTPSVLLGWGNVPRQWSCKQVQLQDLGQSKSTCHMRVRERQPQSEWAGLMYDKLTGPFLFLEKTVTRCSYLDMELYTLPQLPPHTALQKDGAAQHFCHLDREMAWQKWMNCLAS
jgi:hypothetical protein